MSTDSRVDTTLLNDWRATMVEWADGRFQWAIPLLILGCIPRHISMELACRALTPPFRCHMMVFTARCPPGHGDIYPSLLGSGMLDRLIEKGIKCVRVVFAGWADLDKVVGGSQSDGQPSGSFTCTPHICDIGFIWRHRHREYLGHTSLIPLH